MTPPPAHASAAAWSAPPPPPALWPEAVDLLHCLGFVYLRHGQARRAAVLLLLAARGASGEDGGRPDVLRALAAALARCGLGEQAAAALDRAEAADPAAAAHPMSRLLRARALLAQGRREEAKRVFRDAAP